MLWKNGSGCGSKNDRVCLRGKESGWDNELFGMEKTVMVFGVAKKVIEDMVKGGRVRLMTLVEKYESITKKLDESPI
jgi:hypothetical protein